MTARLDRVTGTWVEYTTDNGSTVWGCTRCLRGEWHVSLSEAESAATTHAATTHGGSVVYLGLPTGPRPDTERDSRILALHAGGASQRAIAREVGMTGVGVGKALKRLVTT